MSEQATIWQRWGRGAGLPIPGSGVLSPWPFCAAHPWPCCSTGGHSLLPSPHRFLSALLSSPQQPLFCATPQDPSSFLLPASPGQDLARVVWQEAPCASPSSQELSAVSWLPAPTQSTSGKPCASGVVRTAPAAPGLIPTLPLARSRCVKEKLTLRGLGHWALPETL